jgi:hypothetical protein
VIDTRLILLEGISGSGKSTIGQHLYRIMHLNVYPVEFYHEFYRPHPILGVESEAIVDWIHLSLARWRKFVHDWLKRDDIAIVDGAFFQCGIGELLERDTDDQTMTNYGREVVSLIKPLQPVLIHLYQEDIAAALKRVTVERPRRWKNRVAELFTNSVYGRNRSLEGFDLYLDYNKSLRRLSDDLFSSSNISKLAVENYDRDHLQKICGYLDLKQPADPFDPHGFCGEYIEKTENRRCNISVMDGALTVEGLFRITKNLLPKCEDTLFVQTWPDELTFTRDNAGRVITFRSTGPWNRLGPHTWRRTTFD